MRFEIKFNNFPSEEYQSVFSIPRGVSIMKELNISMQYKACESTLQNAINLIDIFF